ncbi:hypothetical protein [Agrobacterium rubi]|nr:hypothetical protein [Agrobacterium rubi]
MNAKITSIVGQVRKKIEKPEGSHVIPHNLHYLHFVIVHGSIGVRAELRA